jgi:hypothetical protein
VSGRVRRALNAPGADAGGRKSAQTTKQRARRSFIEAVFGAV